MASSVTIANRALTLIGVERITSLDDATARARACKSEYDNSRLAELQSTNWSFALVRTKVASSAIVPSWGFSLAYPYPVDAVRIVQVADYFVGLTLTNYRTTDEVEYALEARQILTNISAPLPIRYVKDAQDASQFAPLFVDAVANRLACAICIDLTQSVEKLTKVQGSYQAIIDAAKRCNAVEKPPVALPDDSWMLSRI